MVPIGSHRSGERGQSPYVVQLGPPGRRSGLPPTGVHLVRALRVTLPDVVHHLGWQAHEMLSYIVRETLTPQVDSVGEFCVAIYTATETTLGVPN